MVQVEKTMLMTTGGRGEDWTLDAVCALEKEKKDTFGCQSLQAWAAVSKLLTEMRMSDE